MDRPFDQVFLDKENNTYVLDNKGILYYHDDYLFVPFTRMLNNIKKVFSMDDKFYVHHGTTLTVFDDSLIKIKYDDDGEDWITNNIIDIDYHADLDMVVTYEKSDDSANIWIYNNVHGHYSDYYQGPGIKTNKLDLIYMCQNEEISGIKIVDNVLLVYSVNIAYMFLIDYIHAEYIGHINITENIFSQIVDYNARSDSFILNDGDKLSRKGFVLMSEIRSSIIHNQIYIMHGAFFIQKNKNIYCYCKPQISDSIASSLNKILDITNINNESNVCLITAVAKYKYNIVQNGGMQLSFCNGKLYVVWEHQIINIAITDDNIDYDNIINDIMDKPGPIINIDINENESIVEQLLPIIPRIYRLHTENDFSFEYLDSNDNVFSYGNGVTRIVFNNMTKELDDILKNKFKGYDLHSVYKLGKLFYFCVNNSGQLFSHIHPYFFYKFASDDDYLELLKKFKGNDYPTYSRQYLDYLKDPTKLIELDVGCTTAKDYLKYIITSDLTCEEIALYEKFIDGFNSYNHKHTFYPIIKNLPITYYISLLVSHNNFYADIIFRRKTETINKKLYDTFCILFKKALNEMPAEKKLLFSQNLTGSKYYTGPIHIIYGYEDKKLAVRQAVYNEQIAESLDDEPVEANDIVIDGSIMDEPKLEYQISTCSTEIIVNIPPTTECVNQLLDHLTIEDKSIKN